MFDASQFLEITVEGQNDTKTIPVPVGEYIAVVKEVKARNWSKKDDPTVNGVSLDVTWTIDSEAVAALLGRKEVTCRQNVMLDVTETGGLDMGKGRNVGLGRLREATGTNVAGQPFSFLNLVGRPAKVIVEHRISGEDVFSEIKKVAKLA